MKLEFSETDYTIYQFCPNKNLPQEVISGAFALVRTPDELSVVAPSAMRLGALQENAGWRCFRVAGTLDFDMIGIMFQLSQILATAGISIFVISTYNTDYVFVRSSQLELARKSLTSGGYQIGTY